jgi:glycosyl transferase family 1
MALGATDVAAGLGAMRILWVVTKPPWPLHDGGRVVVANTLRALRAAGHEPLLVSPFDPTSDDRDHLTAALREFCEPYLVAAPPRPLGPSIVRARARGLPVTIGRHTLPAVSAEVERVLARHPCAVVHAEQLQALPQCEPARRRSIPIVLRAQNVESDLWSESASRWSLVRGVVRREAARLAGYEGRAVREVAATIALTERDAERFRVLSNGGCPIHPLAVPFPDRLPPAAAPLAGEPAVVVLASGWIPNRDGAGWFCRTWWPHVRAQCPRAILHLFGRVPGIRPAPAIAVHEPPVDSREAFAPGAILAVPLRIASGVRVKILEAWARGVPVVATPQAAAGLDARDGRELLIAPDPPGFASAIGRLHADPSFAQASVDAGRALLRARHDPLRIAERLASIYADVVRSATSR